MAPVYHKKFLLFLVGFCTVQFGLAFYVFENVGTDAGVYADANAGIGALARKNMSLNFLDVGQGDATYIVAPNGNSLLIDAGPPTKKVLESLSKVAPFFNSRIDLLLATHPDNDHVGGFSDVASKYNFSGFVYNGVTADNVQYKKFLEKSVQDSVQNTIQNFAQKSLQIYTQNFAQKIIGMHGISIVLDKDAGVVFKILSPSLSDILENYERCFNDSNNLQNKKMKKQSYKKTRAIKKCKKLLDLTTNDSSIVGRLTYGDTSVMLTGDASVDVEKSLIANLSSDGLLPDYLHANILKVGHHGSKTSTSLDFLHVVNPQLAVISVGQKNTYGHPHKIVLDNLKALNLGRDRVFRTDEVGTIGFIMDGLNIVHN